MEWSLDQLGRHKNIVIIIIIILILIIIIIIIIHGFKNMRLCPSNYEHNAKKKKITFPGKLLLLNGCRHSTDRLVKGKLGQSRTQKMCFKLCLSSMSFVCTIHLKRLIAVKTTTVNAVICEKMT